MNGPVPENIKPGYPTGQKDVPETFRTINFLKD
jgi:hypothetical protein